jgi:hypothetical protein
MPGIRPWRFCKQRERAKAQMTATRRIETPVLSGLRAITCAIKTNLWAVNNKGLPKKAFVFNVLFWLPDLDSNQGPAD